MIVYRLLITGIFFVTVESDCYFYPYNGHIRHWHNHDHSQQNGKYSQTEYHVNLNIPGGQIDVQFGRKRNPSILDERILYAKYCHYANQHWIDQSGKYILVDYGRRGLQIWVDVTEGHCGHHDCCHIGQPVYDYCQSQPCQNGGTCYNHDMGATCRCAQGYHGYHCEHQPLPQQFNYCQSSPCHNGGTCTQTGSGYNCTCPVGFRGQTCASVIDYCHHHLCQRHGRCESSPSGFKCICHYGFTGSHCEIKIDYCNTNPCGNHGSCQNHHSGYTCHCNQGYEGSHCEKVIDRCNTNPCGNHGSCQNHNSEYICHCNQGYEGSNCEKEIDFKYNCFPDPCHGHGRCYNALGGFTCACNSGYEGATCDKATTTVKPLAQAVCADTKVFHCQTSVCSVAELQKYCPLTCGLCRTQLSTEISMTSSSYSTTSGLTLPTPHWMQLLGK